MNNSKKINVSYSSLVGLKAELLRKHAEVEEVKAKQAVTKTNLPKAKVKTKTIKNKEEKKSNNKSGKVTEIEDINLLNKSKYMLEAKSKLYDKLKKQGYRGGNNNGNDDDDDSNRYLVDFSNKSDESEPEIHREDDYDDYASDPEEDWVEYQDCFGRTRKCLRKDLPKMKEKDNLIKEEIVEKKVENENENNNKTQYKFIPPEKEPEIEIMRKKWEEQEEKLTHKSDIHYQDVLFDEARNHGVGYYAFSQDEEERAKQQANLAKLRKETEQRQKELEEIKELKSKMELNRLKAARVRQRIRAGLPPEPTEEEIAKDSQATTAESSLPESATADCQPAASTASESETSTEANNSKDSEHQEKNNLKTIEDKIKAFGELLGKRPKWRELSQEEWIQKRRKDRHGEFAPVYDNFTSRGYLKHSKDYQLVAKQLDEEDDPLRLKINGPDPTDLWDEYGPDNQDQEDDDEQKVKPSDAIITPQVSNVENIQNSTLSAPSDISTIDFSQPPPPTHFIPTPVSNSSVHPHRSSEVNPPVTSHHSSDSSDDDSDIIGPLPPPTITEDNFNLSQIPLPSDTPPGKNKEITSTNKINVDSKKIDEMLKYLRNKFDSVDN